MILNKMLSAFEGSYVSELSGDEDINTDYLEECALDSQETILYCDGITEPPIDLTAPLQIDRQPVFRELQNVLTAM